MSSVLCSVEDFQETAFDYLIIGGGTAGLVLAARLSEDPSVTVGVIEAGEARLDDPFILTPLLFTKLAGNETYDWMLKTVPQAGTNGKVHAMPRGKVLGGSSAINFMIYVRGEREEYDDWCKVSGEGWSWADLEPYFRKHEGLLEPQPESTMKPAPVFQKEDHGTDGPIRTSFANWHPDVEEDWHDSLSKVVFKKAYQQSPDGWNGRNIGLRANLSVIDRTAGPGLRSYSASGYLKPILARSNLKVLTSAHAEKILIEKPHSEGQVATGVVCNVSGKRFVVKSKREVLLCAGTFNTPQILELSGVGNRAVLEKAGVSCLVENNAVGENLQDHPMTCMVYELSDSETSLDMLAKPEILQEAMQQYGAGKGGPLANGVDHLSFAPVTQIANAEEIARLQRRNLSSEDKLSEKKRAILMARLASDKSASLQFAFLGAKLDPRRMDNQAAFLNPEPSEQNCVTVGVSVSHPFSHGSVHIESNDFAKPPRIDPAYMTDDLDVETTSIGLRVADNVFKSEPLSLKIKGRVYPPEEADLNDHSIRTEYIRECAGTQYHPVGTAALGSVVDASLRVKGVSGLRVIDASIFPMHISGNIQATVYAVAEKAADIIKAS